MDHSHAADKSIKHYTDAKRVPTRKVTGEGMAANALPICLFHLSLSLSPGGEPPDRGRDKDMKGGERRFQFHHSPV